MSGTPFGLPVLCAGSSGETGFSCGFNGRAAGTSLA
jgi:hypothetical protein